MLYGHKDKISLFKKLALNDNLSHAYLFYGLSGIGKFYFARTLASFLESGDFYNKEPFIDSRFFLPDEKGKIGVEVAREIKQFLSGTPFKSPRRLAVVRDTETLTPEAESALLKIVEEPPAKAMIVFIAADLQALFIPLRSRLSRVYFPSFSTEEVKEFLMKEHGIPASKAFDIAARSFNRPGVALTLLRGKEMSDKEESLEQALSEKIVSLYRSGVVGNSGVLKELMSRESVIHRYNLNRKLQEKAIDYIIG